MKTLDAREIYLCLGGMVDDHKVRHSEFAPTEERADNGQDVIGTIGEDSIVRSLYSFNRWLSLQTMARLKTGASYERLLFMEKIEHDLAIEPLLHARELAERCFWEHLLAEFPQIAENVSTVRILSGWRVAMSRPASPVISHFIRGFTVIIDRPKKAVSGPVS
jgi:hypothetical protein